MRLVTSAPHGENGTARVGAVLDGYVVDLPAAAEAPDAAGEPQLVGAAAGSRG